MRDGDQQTTADRNQVIHAASALGVSEFSVFELAYRGWFRQDADTRVLESHFVDYLFYGKVPCWVRHYVRGLCHEHWRPDAPHTPGPCAFLLQCALWLGLRPPALHVNHEVEDRILQA